MSPSYIKELVVPYTPARRLRSSNRGLLKIPKSRTSSFGDRMFGGAARRLWNSLPDNIRLNNSSIDDFKRSLKTYNVLTTSVLIERIKILVASWLVAKLPGGEMTGNQMSYSSSVLITPPEIIKEFNT